MRTVPSSIAFLAIAAFCLPWSAAQAADTTQEVASSGASRQLTREQYSEQLQRLQIQVAQCQHKRDFATCDPAMVGSDVEVSFSGGQRAVSYAWLRHTLRQASAGRKDADGAGVHADLTACIARLEQMQRDTASPQVDAYTPGNISSLQHSLDNIFASGDFPAAKPPSFWQRAWDALARWLLNAFRSVAPGRPSRTTLYLLEIAVMALPCGLLIWWFIRRLQIQNLGLPQPVAPHPSAPSAQDWRAWLDEAQRLGRDGHWREAIHHVYWSAISCLEAQGLWPADRTRTPREYLGLVSGNPLRNDLFSLTQTFERTWYGSRPAAEPDFEEACNVLKRIAAQ